MAGEEARLVERCLRGNQQAIRDLVEQFQADVYGLCVRVLGDFHEAEDVAQEAFLRVFRSLRRWDGARPLKPWIMRIAFNRCRTVKAKQARRPVELVDYLPNLVADRPADDSAELVREIRLALEALRLEHRTVFVLFHEQGLRYEAIAEVMDHPVGTIKTWLHRARLEVLEQLRKRGMVTEARHELP